MMRMILVALAVWAAGCVAPPVVDASAVPAAPSAVPPLKVAVYVGRGPGGIGAVEWLRLVQESPEMELHLVDAEGLRSGALGGLDLLVMPGGSSDREYKSLGTNGVERLKAFLRAGGGYIGTCAGCALVMDEKTRARLIPWKWSGAVSGTLFPTLQLNEKGAAALGLKPGPIAVRYHGGPFMWPSTNVMAEVKTESWATFDAEASLKGPIKAKTRMYGSTAIVGGTYGKGRLVAFTVHPEYCGNTLPLVTAAIRYVTGRDVTFPVRARTPRALAVGYLAASVSGVENVETMLALAAERTFDLVPVDAAAIGQRGLDHLDVLVIPTDSTAKNAVVRAGIRAFAARGGKMVGFGGGVNMLPPGGVVCGTRQDAVRTIRALFP